MHEVCIKLPGISEKALKGKWISGDRGRGWGLGPTCTPHGAPLHLQSQRIRIWFSLRKLEITKGPTQYQLIRSSCFKKSTLYPTLYQSPATLTKQISILVSATSGLLNHSGWSRVLPPLSTYKVPVPPVQPGKEDSKAQLHNCFSSSPDSLQFLTLLN